MAVVIVGALYLVLAFAVIVVLGPGAADSSAPLGDLMASGLGATPVCWRPVRRCC